MSREDEIRRKVRQIVEDEMRRQGYIPEEQPETKILAACKDFLWECPSIADR